MEYIETIEKEGLTEEYQEFGKRRDVAKSAYSSINNVIENLTVIQHLYDEMLLLIPRFGDDYDSLGRNTKVNIEAFKEDSEKAIKNIVKFNSGSEDSTIYYQEAEEKDKLDEVTIANKKTAEKKLNDRIAALKANKNNSNDVQTNNSDTGSNENVFKPKKSFLLNKNIFLK